MTGGSNLDHMWVQALSASGKLTVTRGGIGDLWAGTRAQAMATAQPLLGLQAARALLSKGRTGLWS
eukprot:scaffold77630_cov30-Phaeocystis_antarctica.AAC.2